MKRTLIGLVCLALSLLATNAGAQEVTARDADGQRPATIKEIRSLLADLGDLQQELASVTTASSASEVADGAEADWRWDECRFQSLNDPLWTAREELLTLRCITDKTGVDYGTALRIGNCESGMSRFAYNPAGPYVGIYQHAYGTNGSTYIGRVHTYEPRAWDHPLSTNWRNSRGMIVTSVRMMDAVGFSPWSCY